MGKITLAESVVELEEKFVVVVVVVAALELGFSDSQAAHLLCSGLLSTMQTSQVQVPGGFLNLSPQEDNDDEEEEATVLLMVGTPPLFPWFVSGLRVLHARHLVT